MSSLTLHDVRADRSGDSEKHPELDGAPVSGARLCPAVSGLPLPTSALHRLIYVSRSRVPFNLNSPLELLDGIVSSARPRNELLGITGVLLYDGRHFAQVLEGEGRDVRAVFAAIAIDSRHEDVKVLENGAVAARAFAAWSVRFFDSADGTETEFPGKVICNVSQESAQRTTSLIALLRYCVLTFG